jgi:hypothetical protein
MTSNEPVSTEFIRVTKWGTSKQQKKWVGPKAGGTYVLKKALSFIPFFLFSMW